MVTENDGLGLGWTLKGHLGLEVTNKFRKLDKLVNAAQGKFR